MLYSRSRAVALARPGVAALAAIILPIHAGTYSNDFSSDPFSASLPANQRLTVFSNQAVGNVNRPSWVATGGVSNSGYMKLTDAIGSIRSTIVFPDFEPGFKVAGFNFGVDCRIGGGAAAPADGFSINFARKDQFFNDGVITNGTPYAGANNVGHTEADRHEEGTLTGLGIGFDAYDSGGEDVIGISVRLDNNLLTQVELPTLNGSATDDTSLQTGPLVAGTAEERVAALGWGRFEVNLNPETHMLDVWWKGKKVIDQLDTGFNPSAGRLVFGARTGGQNQVHHFDNISLQTFPVEVATLTSARVGHDGFFFQISDYGSTSVVTPADVDYLDINGVQVTPNSVTKNGGVTTVHYMPPTPFAPNTAVSFYISATDQNDKIIDLAATLTTPVLPQQFFLTTAPTLNQWNIREIRGGTVTGTPPINSALTIAATPPGTPSNYTAPYFNLSDDTDFGSRGRFKRDAAYVSGVTGNDDNIVGLGRTKIQITEAGPYTFHVQSDDGFALRINGASFSKVAGNGIIDGSEASTIAFLNGGANSDTRGTVDLTVGEYVLDFLWFEGTGGSFAEVSWAKGDHTVDVAGGKWSLVGGAGDTPFFPAAPFDLPPPPAGKWSVRNSPDGGDVLTLRAAFARVATPGASVITNATTPVVNFRDPQNAGADGFFRNNVPFPMEAVVAGVDDNQFVTIGRYEFVAATAGDYTFAITGDDGIAFRMLGGPYLINNAGPTNNNSGIDGLDSTAFLNTNSSDQTSYGVYRIATPGTYTIEVIHVEQGGGASFEVAWVPGNFTSLNATSAWRLLGTDTDPSLPIAAPILPNNLFDQLPLATATNWSVRFFYSAGLGNLQTAITAMQNPATPNFSGFTQFLNYRNFPGSGQTETAWTSGLFHATSATVAYQTPAEQQYLGTAVFVDNVAALATSRIVIPTSGNYTFGISSDDGFAFRIVGAPNGFSRVSGTATIDSAQPNTVYRLTGSNNCRAVINLPAGQYDLEFAYYEGGGNAHFEVYAVAGDITNDADSTGWRIVGHTGSGGLGLAAQPATSTLPSSVNNLTINPQTGAFSFNWGSQDGASYKIQYSENLVNWHDLNPSYPAQPGGTTTYNGNVSSLTQISQKTRVFFRLSE